MSLNDSDPAAYFRRHVFCCTNQRGGDDPRGCCQARGGVSLRNYFKKQVRAAGVEGVRVNASGCLDRCEFGPTVVIYPEGVWYSVQSEGDIDEIISRHLIGGGRVERLMLAPDQAPPENNPADKMPAEN
jgi:(2Fe-2S) ferredoxin